MFLVTFANWIGVPLFATLPFLLSNLGISVTDAVFESVSGVTTTGATVLSGLDDMPKDILLWRSMTQWLGGLGFIGMAVAVLPFLRVGGMRLFQTESSDWSEKAVPRARTLIRSLTVAYLVLSFLCMFSYWIGGMTWFDAVNHAMTTISTAGYSTSDASLGSFPQPWIQWSAVLFMTLGGMPFVLFIKAFSQRSLFALFDSQVKAYLSVIVLMSILIALYLYLYKAIAPWEAITLSFVNVTSVITTTGYASADYGLWGEAAVVAFFFMMFIGGCSGSTSGGIKIFRFQLFFLILYDQLIKSVHPRAVTTLRYNSRKVNEDVVSSSIAFMFMAMGSFGLLAFILGLTGLDLTTSLSGSLTALMNVGPGLGEIIGPPGNFEPLPTAAKWAMCAGMLLGRLEFLAIYILFTRMFWRG
jgi:trk system potassium uptake protein TrkH